MSLEHAITFAALKCLGTKELSKHRDLLVGGAEHPIVLAIVGTAGDQKAVLMASGQVGCERDSTRHATPATKEILAAVLSLCGATQRSKLVKLVPALLGPAPTPLQEIPQEFVIIAEQLLRQLRQPKPCRGALKFVYDLE